MQLIPSASLGSASHDQSSGELRGRVAALEGVFVTEPQVQIGGDAFAGAHQAADGALGHQFDALPLTGRDEGLQMAWVANLGDVRQIESALNLGCQRGFAAVEFGRVELL